MKKQFHDKIQKAITKLRMFFEIFESPSSSECTPERYELLKACNMLRDKICSDDDRSVAFAIASLSIAVQHFMDRGEISYESIDCELMKMEVTPNGEV